MILSKWTLQKRVKIAIFAIFDVFHYFAFIMKLFNAKPIVLYIVRKVIKRGITYQNFEFRPVSSWRKSLFKY